MTIEVDSNLCLRSLTTGDARAMIDRVDESRDCLARWLSWVDSTRTAADTAKTILQWQAKEKEGSDFNLGIFEQGRYIGGVGLMRINRLNLSGMLGYWLNVSSQGRGVAVRCARALTEYGFLELGLNRIYIMCHEGNEKSRALAERLGFVMEGLLRQAEILNGQFHNVALYAALRADWIG